MAGPADDAAEIQLLDRDDGWTERATVERDPARAWKWVAVGAALLGLVGFVGWLLDSDDAVEAEPTETSTPVPTTRPTADNPIADGDATPALTPAGVPEGVVGPFDGDYPLPDRIEPPGIPASSVLLGHTADAEFVSIDSGGRVVDVLGRDGARFLPQTHTTGAVVGTLSFTGEWIIVSAAGVASRARVNDGNAPTFVPGGPNGWVVHEKRTGEVLYLDPAGALVGQGPTLPEGFDVIAAMVDGLLVTGRDEAVSLIDFVDGGTLADVDGRLLFAAGRTYVAERCFGLDGCPVVTDVVAPPSVEGGDGEPARLLPLGSSDADRSVLGISPGGGIVAFRHADGVSFALTSTAKIVVDYPGKALGGLTWLGDKFAVVWEPDGATSLIDLVEGTVAELDLGGVIDPTLRGVVLIAPG